MEYAIQTLDLEKRILEDCLKGISKEEYPFAFKDRDKRLKEIKKAIEILESHENN